MSGKTRLSAEEKLALLGYGPETRLLIVNGDDLGSCQAATAATLDGLERGLLTSSSLMVPCPWGFAAGRYLRDHPALDAGVHLTATSEWATYRWGPVLGAERCPSLCDEWGFFWRSEAEVWDRAEPEEVRAEAEAQIQRALAWGHDPSHLDGHMSTFYAEPRFLAIYLELARRYRLPMRLGPRRRYEAAGAAEVYDSLPLGTVLTNDDIRSVELEEVPREEDVLEALRDLEPGITELIVHVAYGTPEAQAALADWEARAEAARLMLDVPAIREELERNQVVLVGWRALREAQRKLPDGGAQD